VLAAFYGCYTFVTPAGALAPSGMELYDFTVLYRRGSLHGNADALSRMNFDELAQLTADSNDEDTDIIIFIISLEFDASTQHAGLFGSNLALEQDTDATLVWMKQRLAMDTSHINEEETELNVQQAKLLTAKKQFVLIKSVLYVRDGRPDGNGHFFRFVVPESAVNLVMRHVHCTATNGHLGVRKSTAKVQERFWWLGWREAIFDFVRSCMSCQLNKHTQLPRVGALQPIRPLYPGDIVASDIKPLPTSRKGI
jgi:hypothetical protein